MIEYGPMDISFNLRDLPEHKIYKVAVLENENLEANSSCFQANIEESLDNLFEFKADRRGKAMIRNLVYRNVENIAEDYDEQFAVVLDE